MSYRLHRRDVDPVKIKWRTFRSIIQWDQDRRDEILAEIQDIFSKERIAVVTIILNGVEKNMRQAFRLKAQGKVYAYDGYMFDFGSERYTWGDKEIYIPLGAQDVLFSYFIEGNDEPRMSMTVRNLRRKLGNDFLAGWKRMVRRGV